ncbi:MAG: hypothetical protein HYT30_02320 [Parcubacteria group bacterium]|nr:hypothetical protein [Parcubacteria group bacterium]
MNLYITARYATLIALIAATLHFVWENMHVPLYGGYEHITTFPITWYATLGDVGYTLAAIALVSLIKAHTQWLRTPSALDMLSLAIVGAWIAVFVEYKAFALEKWFYLDTMPIIPILGVGLTPVVQMAVLLPLSVWIASRCVRGILDR